MDFKTEILKSIETMIDRKLDNYRSDRTYKSVIKSINKKGYVVLDETGNERAVPCCIPNIELRVGQSVYVKIPMNRLNDIHICGIAGIGRR